MRLPESERRLEHIDRSRDRGLELAPTCAKVKVVKRTRSSSGSDQAALATALSPSEASQTRKSTVRSAQDTGSELRLSLRRLTRLTPLLTLARQCFVRRGFSSRPNGQKSSQENVQNGPKNTLVEFRFLSKSRPEPSLRPVTTRSSRGLGGLTSRSAWFSLTCWSRFRR